MTRETLSDRLLDSRGWPELLMTDQRFLKKIQDTYGCHVDLALPPVRQPRNRTHLQLVIRPLGKIEEDRPGQVDWMPLPPYPATVDKVLLATEQRLDRFAGRMSESVPPALTQIDMAVDTHFFLQGIRQVFKQILQLCQVWLSDAELARITGSEDLPRLINRQEILQDFDLDLDFSASDLDLDWVLKIAEVLAKFILPLDTLNVVQRDRLVARLLAGVDPNLADDVVIPASTAKERETEDEYMNFAKISAGVEPTLAEGGQDFGLRAQVLSSVGEKNPEALGSLKPNSRKIYDARLAHLVNQANQVENAKIGRRMGKSALGG
jgi:hypothetical protein